MLFTSGSETDVLAVKWFKGNLAWGESVENISFNFTVFLEFLDCMQSVRVLSNFELEKPVTIFILFSVCSWSVFRAKVLSFQIKIRGKWQEEEQSLIKGAL